MFRIKLTSLLAIMLFSLLFLAGLSAAQTPSLLSLLQSQPDLSELTNALTLVPDLAGVLGGSSDITILAPTNAAFQALLSTSYKPAAQAIRSKNTSVISALLAYHVIDGTYKSTDFKATPAFVNTLFDQSFSVSDTVRTNVAGGQNVDLVLDGKDATILSGEGGYSVVTQAVGEGILL